MSELARMPHFEGNRSSGLARRDMPIETIRPLIQEAHALFFVRFVRQLRELLGFGFAEDPSVVDASQPVFQLLVGLCKGECLTRSSKQCCPRLGHHEHKVRGHVTFAAIAKKLLTFDPMWRNFPAAPLPYPTDDYEHCEFKSIISLNFEVRLDRWQSTLLGMELGAL